MSREHEVDLVVEVRVSARNVKVLELVRTMEMQVETGVAGMMIVCVTFEPREEFVSRVVVAGWVARHTRAHCLLHHLFEYLELASSLNDNRI